MRREIESGLVVCVCLLLATLVVSLSAGGCL